MNPGAALAVTGVVSLAIGCGGKRGPAGASGGRDAGDAGVVVDAHGAVTTAAMIDAAPALAATAPGYQVIDTAHAGTVRVTVEWPTAPAALRRSPGRTTCGGERAPRVRIGTLHGVADALVILDVGAGKAPPPAGPVRVTARDCAITPAVVLAPGLGDALVIESAELASQTVVATALGPAWASAATAEIRARSHLPVLGHAVAIALPEVGAIAVALEGAGDDAAIAIAPPHPYLAVTDEVGVARLEAVPPGTYPVRAWLPMRGGHAAVTATGSVTIAADADAAVTLVLAP